MADNSVEISIKAKDEATPVINKTTESLGGVEKAASKTQKSVTSTGLSFTELAGAVGVGSLAADAFSNAVGSIGGFLKETVTSALEAQSAYAGYQQILSQASGASSEQINALHAQAEALGQIGIISDDVIMATQSTLATFDLQAESIKKLTPSFVDMIAKERGFNATTQDATAFGNAFGKVLQGNVGALSDYGFKFDKNTEKILKNGTETEKIQALTELLDSTYKDFNKTMGETTEGKLVRFNNVLDDIKKNIGNAFLPTLDLFIGSAADTATEIKNATEKSDEWGRTVYSVGSALKATGSIVMGVAKIIGAFAVTMVGAALTWGGFAKDVIGYAGKIKDAIVGLFSAMKKAFAGDFEGAIQDANKSLSSVVFSFDNTKAAAETAGKMSASAFNEAVQSFKDAGAAVVEGVVQKGFKPVSEASSNLKEKVKGDLDSLGGAADKTGEKYKKAAEKFAESVQSFNEKLIDLTKEFTKKSADMLEQYQSKVADIQKSINEEQKSYDKESIDAKKAYNEEFIKLFIEQQDRVKELTQKQTDIQKKLLSGGGGDTNDLQTQQEEVKKQLDDANKQIAVFKKEQTDIEKLADAERNKTSLDRLKEQFAEEQATRDADHQAKLLDLQTKMAEEKALYEKNKQELIDETIDKYAKIDAELNKGWEKMKEDTKGHIKEMQALETQVMSIKASIEAARASISGGGGGAAVGARADGGPVSAGRPYIVGERGPEMFVPNSSGTIIPNNQMGGKISIMQGANISVRNDSDIQSIASAVASQLARTLEAQRSGLATAS